MGKSKDDSRRLYQSESQARSALIGSLKEHFDFFEEVTAIGAEGDTMRLDAVSRCRETGWTLGWEFKKSHLFKKEFAGAIRQAIHYRLARISDARLPELIGEHLPAVIVFPDWLGEHDDDVTNYGKEAEGMRLVAGQFRVGTLRPTNAPHSCIIVSQSAIWHSGSGWTGTAEGVLFGKRSLGAVRRKDK